MGGTAPDLDELLLAGALDLGVCLGAKEASAFRTYREEILRWSERMNLTAFATPVAVVRQGFLDSLACAPLFPAHTERVLDVGSGAGFPAIPLALAKPGLAFTLVEPSRKKLTFLRHVARTLALTGVRIHPGRLEIYRRDKEMVGAFDVALARAVAPLRVVASMILPFLRPCGVFLAQVGSGENLTDSRDDLLRSGLEIAAETPVPAWLGKPGRRILTLRRSRSR